MSEERVKSGIIGLDELMEGGFPRGFSYAVVGGPGSGKTTFGAQYLCNGISSFGENGVYVTFDEPPYSISNNMKRFGWNLYDLESRGKFAFVDVSPIVGDRIGNFVVKSGFLGAEEFNVDSVIGVINDARRKVGAKRCVIDSITALQLQLKDEFETRVQTLKLIKALTEMKLTTILLAESEEERVDVQRFSITEFLAQGVILLHVYRIGDSAVRALEIRKIRGVKHLEKLCPFKITENGIEVYPQQTVFVKGILGY